MTYFVAILFILLAAVSSVLIAVIRILKGKQNIFSWCDDDEYQEYIPQCK